mmetsp:Transcript_87325/g.138559  ORF Transcript_87325/g.138559 Transcript_87325/m.138559 type:complete len:268 (+) Transcript_87325:47-850(+)
MVVRAQLRGETGLAEIYSRLRDVLGLEDQGPADSRAVRAYQIVAGMGFTEGDIVTMEDLAAAFVEGLLGGRLPPGYERIMAHLSCLLHPGQEELLPQEGRTHWRIWEIFAAAQHQQRQFCVVAVYAGCVSITGASFPSSDPIGFLENHPLVEAMQRKFRNLMVSFQETQMCLTSTVRISLELETKMANFTVRLRSFLQETVRRMTRRQEPYGNLAMLTAIDEGMRWMEQRCSWLSAEAGYIALKVRQLIASSPDMALQQQLPVAAGS